MPNIALDFPNGYKDERPQELLDGVLQMAPSPGLVHLDIQHDITAIFKKHFKGGNCRVYFEPNVYFSEKDKPIPDVAVVCNPEIIGTTGIHGAPNLIVEILSRSTSKRDKGYKHNLYERYGVHEHWIVDIKNRSITVYMLNDGRYYIDNVYAIPDDDELEIMSDEDKAAVQYEFKTHLSDALVIDIREVFESV